MTPLNLTVSHTEAKYLQCILANYLSILYVIYQLKIFLNMLKNYMYNIIPCLFNKNKHINILVKKGLERYTILRC